MSVTTERVLEKSCKFGVAIRNVSCCMRFGTGRVSKRGYDISEGQKATVNRDTLFDALSRGSSPLKLEKNRYKYWKKTHGSITYSFRTRQIDEMEFGYDGNPVLRHHHHGRSSPGLPHAQERWQGGGRRHGPLQLRSLESKDDQKLEKRLWSRWGLMNRQIPDALGVMVNDHPGVKERKNAVGLQSR